MLSLRIDFVLNGYPCGILLSADRQYNAHPVIWYTWTDNKGYCCVVTRIDATRGYIFNDNSNRWCLYSLGYYDALHSAHVMGSIAYLLINDLCRRKHNRRQWFFPTWWHGSDHLCGIFRHSTSSTPNRWFILLMISYANSMLCRPVNVSGMSDCVTITLRLYLCKVSLFSYNQSARTTL